MTLGMLATVGMMTLAPQTAMSYRVGCVGNTHNASHSHYHNGNLASHYAETKHCTDGNGMSVPGTTVKHWLISH